ncbi:MAG: indole-3-glycerol phosphate synthase TrpC [Planctomycetota bacterium]|nr:indole-3-glycerol phosphate synthase TrpC [Planctomycetota bacterium]MDA1177867.1 indole-3-glycerol phosphate synthase TrpC [Planctomycetota bacterium]
MPDTILDRIVKTKLQEIARDRQARPEIEWRSEARDAAPPLDFAAALAAPGPVKLIAEIKRASPSKGIIREDFDPPTIARIYAQHGATCISVLTDTPYFQGCLEHLRAVRHAVSTPLLRKDFILDTYQLWQARAVGADAVLLIAECLDDCQLRNLHQAAIEMGMSPLVECYEPENVERALDAGATLIGINNRNLHTFEIDLEHTLRMREKIPRDCILVGESGIHGPDDLERLAAGGVQAVLVGEHLMASPDIGAAVDRLLQRHA